MGVNLKDIIPHRKINFEDLKGKVIAIDALNSLYQFLASIRQPDGTPLMDSQKRVTSHLSGLLYRTVRLINLGIKPVYVFDGEHPELKKQEIEQRRERKAEAEKEWKKAISEKRLEDAKKFAKRTSKFTDEMLEDSKTLLDLMGVPHVQAPSEGEAQCVHLCEKGDAWATGSQDYDSLLLGTKRLIRGLTLSGSFELELISLEETLKNLNITREQLIDIAILVGTDFNEGIKGIGPKKALKIVKEDKLNELKIDFNFQKVREIFLKPKVTDDYKINFQEPDTEKLVEFLCKEHDFSETRVRKAAGNLKDALKELSQKDLSAWF
jgi:flap endonuclease-1